LAAVACAGIYTWRVHPECLQAARWLGRRTQAGSPPTHAAGPGSSSRAAHAVALTARIHFLRLTAGKERLAAVERQVSAVAPVRAAVEELLSGKLPPGCERPLPAGVTLRGAKVTDGVATVDFSRELTANFRGGSDSEGVAVYAIVDTLTSLPGVRAVQIMVAGHRLDSIGGHVDVSGPLAYDGELVVADQ
jgi:hypothetical protein